jgi:hypothetical protein
MEGASLAGAAALQLAAARVRLWLRTSSSAQWCVYGYKPVTPGAAGSHQANTLDAAPCMVYLAACIDGQGALQAACW